MPWHGINILPCLPCDSPSFHLVRVRGFLWTLEDKQTWCFIVPPYFNVNVLKTRLYCKPGCSHPNQEINSDTVLSSNSQGSFKFLRESQSCPLQLGSNPGSRAVFRGHVSFVSFNLARPRAVLLHQLTGRKKKPWFVVAAGFYGVNIPILANFKLPTSCHYHWSVESGRDAHNWFSRVGLSQYQLALIYHWLPLSLLFCDLMGFFSEYRPVTLSFIWGSSDTSSCLHLVYALCGRNTAEVMLCSSLCIRSRGTWCWLAPLLEMIKELPHSSITW